MNENPKIIIADSHTIESQEAIARVFLREVLDMDYDEVLITDESDLSDFCFCNIEACPEIEGADEYERWERGTLARINDLYKVEIKTSHTRLVQIFDMIDKAVRSAFMPN